MAKKKVQTRKPEKQEIFTIINNLKRLNTNQYELVSL